MSFSVSVGRSTITPGRLTFLRSLRWMGGWEGDEGEEGWAGWAGGGAEGGAGRARGPHRAMNNESQGTRQRRPALPCPGASTRPPLPPPARSPQGGGVEAAHAHGALLGVRLQHLQGDGAVGAQDGGPALDVLQTDAVRGRGWGWDRQGRLAHRVVHPRSASCRCSRHGGQAALGMAAAAIAAGSGAGRPRWTTAAAGRRSQPCGALPAGRRTSASLAWDMDTSHPSTRLLSTSAHLRQLGVGHGNQPPIHPSPVHLSAPPPAWRTTWRSGPCCP